MFVNALVYLALLGVCYSSAELLRESAGLDENSGLIAHVERGF